MPRIDFTKKSNTTWFIIIFAIIIFVEIVLYQHGFKAYDLIGVAVAFLMFVGVALIASFLIYRLSGKTIKFTVPFNTILFYLILLQVPGIIYMLISKIR